MENLVEAESEDLSYVLLVQRGFPQETTIPEDYVDMEIESWVAEAQEEEESESLPSVYQRLSIEIPDYNLFLLSPISEKSRSKQRSKQRNKQRSKQRNK